MCASESTPPSTSTSQPESLPKDPPPQPSTSSSTSPPSSEGVTLSQANLPESLRGLPASQVEEAIRRVLLEKEDNPYRSKKGYEGVRPQMLTEADIMGDIIKVDKEKMAQESRRNIIIGLSSVALVVGSLIIPPAWLIRKTPEECLVPILRLKETLVSLEEMMAEGRLDEVLLIVDRFQEAPFKISENLFDLCRLVGYQEKSMGLRIKMEDVAHDVVEDLRQVDYKNFYDVRGVRKEIADNKYFSFSQKNLLSAKRRLDEFIAMLPKEIRRQGYIKFNNLKAS